MKKIVRQYNNVSIPIEIINPSNFLDKKKGAGQGYLYAHDYKEKTTSMKTLPSEIRERDFYSPNQLGFEKEIHKRMDYWKKIKQKLVK